MSDARSLLIEAMADAFATDHRYAANPGGDGFDCRCGWTGPSVEAHWRHLAGLLLDAALSTFLPCPQCHGTTKRFLDPQYESRFDPDCPACGGSGRGVRALTEIIMEQVGDWCDLHGLCESHTIGDPNNIPRLPEGTPVYVERVPVYRERPQ